MSEELHNLLTEYTESKDKEIERLNNIINCEFAIIFREKMVNTLSATEKIVLQEKEIKRLNNIIDELEKYLKTKLENEISQSYIKGINTALEYIKELKEKE